VATPGGLDREVLLHYAETMIPSVTAELVSVDFLHDDPSSIVDAPPTMVIGDRMPRVVALHDNECGLRMPPARRGRGRDRLQVGFGTGELAAGLVVPLAEAVR
jgi:hypothetical protein